MKKKSAIRHFSILMPFKISSFRLALPQIFVFGAIKNSQSTILGAAKIVQIP